MVRLTICWRLALCICLTLALVAPTQAQGPTNTQEPQTHTIPSRYAYDTWRSFEALTYATTGLPEDNICYGDGGAVTRLRYTSPTNIAAAMWAAIAARDLGFISASQAEERIATTLTSLEGMERAHGFYFNWYDPTTGARLTTWPVGGGEVRPFLSTVDNGWLTMTLMMVSRAVPTLAPRADALVADMDYSFFYDPNVGQLRGGYWTDTDEYTGHHYGTLNTEPRISSYLGIAAGDLPTTHYYRLYRTFPPDWDWQEQRPQGRWETYEGVPVYEGNYQYRGKWLVPSWGGSMFEALMVTLFVPESEWGPTSWGVTHPLYVQSQIEHGMEEAHYGYWGFSPSNNPSGGYREYGVDAIGMSPDGYASNNSNTFVEYGYPGNPSRPPRPLPPPGAYTGGVVTPHASFLALEFAPDAALENLANLRRDYDVYGAYGFYDAVNVSTGQVSRCYLALDQGMIIAALANYIQDGQLRNYFAPQIEATVRPLLAAETFAAGPYAFRLYFPQLGGLLIDALPAR